MGSAMVEVLFRTFPFADSVYSVTARSGVYETKRKCYLKTEMHDTHRFLPIPYGVEYLKSQSSVSHHIALSQFKRPEYNLKMT